MPKARFMVLIPCRLDSTRLPGKALKKLGGKTLIETVYFNAKKALEEIELNADIAVCTDSSEIANTLAESGVPTYMTSSTHKNGTERIAECITRYDLNHEFIIDIQGDEPFVNSEIIEVVAREVEAQASLGREEYIVLPHQLIKFEEAARDSVVKIVLNCHGHVMYMSRALIPQTHKPDDSGNATLYSKHLSVIGFTRSALSRYAELGRGEHESREDIELLRALEDGIVIISPRSVSSTFSIDTEDDLHKARDLMRQKVMTTKSVERA